MHFRKGLLAIALVLSFCGIAEAQHHRSVSVSVSPATATVTAGTSKNFTATVRHDVNNDGVTWLLTGPGALTNSTTTSVTYTAPASVSATTAATLEALSIANTSDSASVSITVNPESAPPPSQVATPTFKPGGGTYSTAQSVTISDTTNGASIHYCIGSCTATASSTTYTGSISVNASETINAIALLTGDTNSAVTSAAYTISTTPPPAPTGSTYYVSPAGSDSSNGSSTAPWLTIQHAANSVTAGDTVYVLAGTYHESVTLEASGSATAGPISFISSPTGAAIVDGTGVSCCGGGANGLFNLNGQSYITINGFEIRNYTTSSASNQPAGILDWGSGSDIQILNNIVHNITTSSEKSGNAHGMAFYGASTTPIDNLTISGNQVYDLKTGNSESVTLSGNVTNFTVTNNQIHDNDNIGIELAGFWGPAPAGVMCGSQLCDRARNGLVSGNTVYNITSYGNPAYGNVYASTGIYVDGGTSIIIEQNTVYHDDFGVEASSENPGNETPGKENASFIVVRNNLIYNNNAAGITIGGYNSTRGGTDSCDFVNNSLYNNDTKSNGVGEFQVQYYATNNIFENNILYAGPQGLFLYNWTNSEANPVVVDYNLYFLPAGAPSSAWTWNSTPYSGYSSYLSRSGNDVHSLFSNPLYVSLSTPDLHVSSSSPAVNAGINLGASIDGTVDFAGNPRVQGSSIDIGAYEQ
jgi:hypothetical protein